MEHERTSDLTGRQLAELLGLVTEQKAVPDVIGRTGAVLSGYLSGPLPLATEVVESLPMLIGRLRESLLPAEGRPVGELLLDGEGQLDIIKRVKEYGKRLARRTPESPDHAAGVAIYYAAIASALLFHEAKITSRGYDDLARSYAKLLAEPWVPPDLGRHFAKARQMCRTRAGQA